MTTPVDEYAEMAYLQYALTTVKGRALANVEDGQKPVQRRLLYTMHQLGLHGQAKPVKSARIVGEVLGKYHPHGDSAAYEAMVRMGQDFTLRYPLVDKQGNFGSRDGDGAAAMRYTEARLSRYAMLLLDELDQGTVDFKDNYDGSFREPVLLPARLPMLLLNGTAGIAVGMTSDTPSHNLVEVAQACALMLRAPEQATLDEILRFMPGPDFAAGARVISAPSVIREAYATGYGALRVRCTWTREEQAHGNWRLVVNEMPQGVSSRQILEQVETLSNPQPAAGKKTLTPQQASLRQMALELLETVRDESGKEKSVRLVFVPRAKSVSIETLQAFLLANTDLETNIPVNLTRIDRDGRPGTSGLVDLLKQWAEFRIDCYTRKCRWERDKLEQRRHILNGRQMVLLALDEIIQVVRTADDPAQELQTEFGLSPLQAEDILAMRLRQLNKLEELALEKELAEVAAALGRLNALLSDETAMRAELVRLVQQDAKTYGDARRTVIEEASPAAAVAPPVADEALRVVISQNHWVRAYREDTAPQFKAGDGPLLDLPTRSSRPTVLLDEGGQAYTLDTKTLPVKGDGVPLSSLAELRPGARPVALVSGEPADEILLATSDAYGFVAPFSALISRLKAGKSVVSVAPDAKVLRALPLGSAAWVCCGSTDGKMLCFAQSEVKRLKSGRGVVLMDATALSAVDVSAAPPLAILDGSGARVPLKTPEMYVLKRARKGAFLPKKTPMAALAPQVDPT